MKKMMLWLVLMLCVAGPALAAPKVITLKDGSTIKGEVVSLIDGRYTIKTDSLGEMTIAEDAILEITAFNAAPLSSSSATTNSLKKSVQAVQSQVMQDENIMRSINALAQNEEIMKLMQDQNFVNMIMSFDEEKIRNSPAVQELMQREDIKRIMNEIQQKIGGE
jgi:gamma-glutamyl phosphate reductase